MSRRIIVVGRGVIGRDQRVVALKEAQGSCLFSQMREQRPKDGGTCPRPHGHRELEREWGFSCFRV